MRKVVERNIGGFTYRVTQLGAVQGRAVMLRLTKALGPTLAALAGAATGKGLDDLGAAELAPLFSSLSLSEDDLTCFCDAFAEATFVIENKSTMPRLDKVFDEHFAGRYGDMVSWLAFAVEVNFADFFRGLGLERGPEKPSESPQPAPSASP